MFTLLESSLRSMSEESAFMMSAALKQTNSRPASLIHHHPGYVSQGLEEEKKGGEINLGEIKSCKK